MEVKFFQVLNRKEIERCFHEQRWTGGRNITTFLLSIVLLGTGFWMFIKGDYWYLGILFIIIGIYGIIYLPKRMVDQNVISLLEDKDYIDQDLEYVLNASSLVIYFGQKIISKIDMDDEVFKKTTHRYIYVKKGKEWGIIKKEHLTREELQYFKNLWRI